MPNLTNYDIWVLRVLWIIVPFSAGPLFSAALVDTSRSFELSVIVGLWVLWALTAVALMIPRPQTLTAIRIIIPATALASIWAAIDARNDLEFALIIVTAIASTGFATSLALRASVADVFVDGSSYGDETRFLLRTPGALLIGPIQLLWATIVAGAVAGPLFLAAQRWILGGIALVAGWGAVYALTPVLHRLSNRFLVFVPAGLVVHDKTALREPQLFRKESITALGPAPSDTELEDLSLNGSGLALRAALKEPSKVMRNSGSRGEDVNEAELTDIDGFVVSPNRPGAVVAEAKERGFAIG